MEEMDSFSKEPFLGYVPGVTGQRDTGHSSLSNSLILFGFFGAATWVAMFWSVLKDSLRNARSSKEKYVLVMTIFVLTLGGILNPTWHSPTALGALFALSISHRRN